MQVVGACKCSNEPSYTKCGEFLDLLRIYFKNGCVPSSWLIRYCMCVCWARSGVVVKALRYKPTGHGFDSRWCHWNFSVT